MMYSTDPTELTEFWQKTIDRMNDQFETAIERNADAQREFMDAWLDSLNDVTEEATIEDAIDGYQQAYEIWMDAAEESIETLGDAASGDDVPVTAFRDTWLNAANESFKALMGTGAFAAATGQAVEELLAAQQQTDEITEDTLHSFGMPTKGDIQTIGDRLVELERRQHAVESKLDTLIEDRDDE